MSNPLLITQHVPSKISGSVIGHRSLALRSTPVRQGHRRLSGPTQDPEPSSAAEQEPTPFQRAGLAFVGVIRDYPAAHEAGQALIGKLSGDALTEALTFAGNDLKDLGSYVAAKTDLPASEARDRIKGIAACVVEMSRKANLIPTPLTPAARRALRKAQMASPGQPITAPG